MVGVELAALVLFKPYDEPLRLRLEVLSAALDVASASVAALHAFAYLKDAGNVILLLQTVKLVCQSLGCWWNVYRAFRLHGSLLFPREQVRPAGPLV